MSLLSSKKNFPRVLQVLPAFEGGGVERGTLDMALALKEKTGEAYVASSGGRLADRFIQRGGCHLTLPLASKNPLVILLNAFRLHRIVKTHRIDLIHVRSRAPAWSVFMLGWATKIPWITTYHSFYSGRSFFKKLYNSVMIRGLRIIAISRFIENLIQTTYTSPPLQTEKIRLVYRGVDTKTFSPSAYPQDTRETLRTKLDIPLDAVVFFLPGRLADRKGHLFFLRAFTSFIENAPPSPPAYLIFSGNTAQSSLEQNIKQEIRDRKLEKHVLLLPYIHDIPRYILASDIIAAPAQQAEAFGRTIIEAGAMERPVIVPNHGAAPEIVLPHQTGWIYQAKDLTACETIIREAYTTAPQKRTFMGQEGRKRALEHFSLEQIIQKKFQIYQDVIE